MPTDWISITEASQLTGYHPEHLRELVREGKIQVSRKGPMFWVDRRSLLAYLRKREKASKTDRRHGPRKRGNLKD
jgi:excisionase family DNA binding protein